MPKFMAVHDSTKYYSDDGVWFEDITGDRYRVDSIERWDDVQFWSWCERRNDWTA